MIRTADQLARLPDGEHRCVTIRQAQPGDVTFLDHLQKKFREQVGFLPKRALETNIASGRVSLALENDEPAAYLLGKGNYLRDPHFGIIYQAAVSYDARRRLMGTALVQHFIDHMEPTVRLIGLWCAQDIEANEFWSACGFEAIAARHGSRSRGRVHIFWVGRTPRGRHEALRYPRCTQGGLMREQREVFGLKPGEAYQEVELPALPESKGEARRRRSNGRAVQRLLAEQQRAFRYGGGKHICVVIAGLTRHLPVAPFDIPNFTDLARVMSATGAASGLPGRRSARAETSALWTPAKLDEAA